MVLDSSACENIGENVQKSEHGTDGRRQKPRAPHEWTKQSFWQMSLGQKIASLDLPEKGEHPQYFEKEKDFDRGPVPYHGIMRENAFIVPMAFFPILVQSASYHFFPHMTWNPWAAHTFYHLWFVVFAFSNVKRLHHFAAVYGTFDEKNRARDIVGDKLVDHLGMSILLYTILRTAGPFLLAYDRETAPIYQFSVWSLPKIMAWEIILDLFFYVYHSACHRIDSLWFIHRAHHGTKHPTPILSILADDYQEVIEVIMCPTLASWVLPLTFGEGFVAIVYLLYVEMLGHSGIRAYWPHPLLTPILGPLNCELAVEDHDLHHRSGRGGMNYGKQTRLWDRLGQSVAERIEGLKP